MSFSTFGYGFDPHGTRVEDRISHDPLRILFLASSSASSSFLLISRVFARASRGGNAGGTLMASPMTAQTLVKGHGSSIRSHRKRKTTVCLEATEMGKITNPRDDASWMGLRFTT